MIETPQSKMTIAQLQQRLTDLGHEASNIVEEQHRICEELMNRAEKAAVLVTDQSKVDWNIVCEAVDDAVINADGHSPGEKGLERQFKKSGLLVVHADDVAAINPT